MNAAGAHLTTAPELPGQSSMHGSDLEKRDRMLMRAALFQAKRGLGRTWPNPSVGAVIADPGTGEIIASAVTAPGGRPHAEVLALAEAGSRARGAIMAVTLEPCAHFGATPPCAEAIEQAGLSELLYGALDPDPRVAGEGVARLAAQGIRVRAGPLAAEARWLNLGHLLRIEAARPFVQLKIGIDGAGFVAAGEGRPVWVTGEDARARAHLLRAEVDAILVGRTTVLQDNPLLTCRLPGLEHRSPVRIVLTTSGQAPVETDLFEAAGPPVWVFAGPDTPPHVLTRLEDAGAQTIIAPRASAGPGLSVSAVLNALAARGITRLLVEGGPSVARAFFDEGVVDEIIIFQGRARMPATAQRLKPFVADGVDLIGLSPRYKQVAAGHAGAASVTVFRLREHLEA